MSVVAVIDYGMGNLRSVAKAIEHVADHTKVLVSSDADEINRADHVVFPGVGALRDCMSELQRLELIDVIQQCAKVRPFLGVCLGMQAMLDSSDENGGTDALGLFPGKAHRFTATESMKVPHMGWNQVHQSVEHPLWHGIEQDSRFYFVHSYYVAPAQAAVVLATTDYTVEFASVIGQGNVFATQFHPEKSQHMGLRLLKNFIAWDGSS